ncbi:MAG: sigma-70 family RNA polymerase sigma factor [Pirellulaceae bacterium]|nr:sigma-70 family RNA polymerase sigma factor [Pirellulaceae bacterium]
MSDSSDEGREALLLRASTGDQSAADHLLGRYRTRLRQMVKCRMDPRLSPRFDPSDVVQEALLAAAVKLPEYCRDRPIGFYPWLRRLTWERLTDLQRKHLKAKRRTVVREEPLQEELPDASVDALAQSLALSATGPLGAAIREERLARIRQALGDLDEEQREVLLLRYLEGLRMNDIAEVLETTVAAVKMRHLRALRRLREALGLS